MKFAYVYIPEDISQPITEHEMELPKDREVECFLDHVKQQLVARNPAAKAAHAQARAQAMLQHLPKGTQVTDDLLKAAGDMHLVENICLLSNSKKNGFVGVNMYVDDSGSLKNLPVNRRATDICQCCGKMLEVYGDAWIARVFDNEDEFRRMDFRQSELSSSAPWVQTAREQMQEKLRSEAAETTINRIQAEANRRERSVVEELSPSAVAKEDGNAAFKKGDYEQAVLHYSKCLELDSKMFAAQNNRAMALLKLGRWKEALQDCDAVLASEPSNVKALLRKGEAHKQLGELSAANTAFADVLRIQPTNQDAAAGLAATSTSTA